MKANKTHKIERWLRPMLGEICWGVNYPSSLNLSMDLGKPRMNTVLEPRYQLTVKDARKWTNRKHPGLMTGYGRWVHIEGPWSLRVMSAHVRFVYEGVTLATSSSTNRRQAIAARYLNGQKMKRIEIDARTGRTRFCFDLGLVVEVRRMAAKSDEELWSIALPNGYFLTVYGNGTYVYVIGSKSDEDADRVPLGEAGQVIVVR